MRLRVKPGARRSAVVGVHGGSLKVAVAAPPERGKANRSVVALLAEILAVPEAAVTIVAGETSQDKVVALALDPDTVRARISAALRPSIPRR